MTQTVPRAFVLACLLALTTIGVAKGATERAKDYHVYHRAGERFVAGVSLYSEDDLPMPFKYPPPAAALLAPLSALPRPVGGALWNAFGALCIAFAIRRWSATPWVAAVGIAACFQSLFLQMDHGQVDGMILALTTLTVTERERRPIAAGVAWGLSCLLKPPAGLLLLPLLLERRFRVVGAATGTGIAAFGLVFWRYGLSATIALTSEWRSLLSVATAPWYLRHDAQGLPSLLLTVWLGADHASPPIPSSLEMFWGLAGSLLSFAAVLAWSRPKGETLYAAILLGIALLSPQAWRANYVMALPALLVLIRGGSDATRPVRWSVYAAVGLSFVVQLVFGEGLLPDRILDPALAVARPFALVYAALFLALAFFAASSSPNASLGSAMSLAPRR